MDGNLELGPFHIPTLSELFPAPEKRIPTAAPRGTETCLEGAVFYVGAKSGGYHIHSLQDMKKIIKDHGGRIGRTIIPSHTYVIGISPHQDFMETIANSKKITARELFDKINESVQQDTNSKNTNKDN